MPATDPQADLERRLCAMTDAELTVWSISALAAHHDFPADEQLYDNLLSAGVAWGRRNRRDAWQALKERARQERDRQMEAMNDRPRREPCASNQIEFVPRAGG